MRTQTIKFNEFMNPTKKELKVQDLVKVLNDSKVKAALSSGVIFTIMSKQVFAYPNAVPVVSDAVKGQIIHAFDPLINLVQLLSYPIAFISISAGCLFIMCNNREKGMSMITTAAIGYIICQMAPLFMKILVGIGSAV